ncbi:MAG: hypothetical protein CO149_05140 [Nitrospirae bacterium CG_4_9_14_3_um_filter_51_5]|nr:MAG: hypothetical protein CO149_05140 [Nitrospirae bacterium CG_4_9_14_3_um_filter_51_5]
MRGKGYEFRNNLSTDSRVNRDSCREKRSLVGLGRAMIQYFIPSNEEGDHEYIYAPTPAEDLTVTMVDRFRIRVWSGFRVVHQ